MVNLLCEENPLRREQADNAAQIPFKSARFYARVLLAAQNKYKIKIRLTKIQGLTPDNEEEGR